MNYSKAFTLFLLSLSSIHAGELILELITQQLVYLNHNLVCALALVSKKLNNNIEHQSRDRQTILQTHANCYPQAVTITSQRFVAWHRYGSACGFFAPKKNWLQYHGCFDIHPGKGDYTIQLCCLQLDTHETTIRYLKTILDDAMGEPQFDDHTEKKYETFRRFGRGMISFMLPLFNKRGDLCTYVYDYDKEVVEHSINTWGKQIFRNAYISYANQVYSLVGFWINDLAMSFVHSKETQEKSGAIIFLTSGAHNNGKSLSEAEYKKIDCICDGRLERFLV
jgi:hypothetical protein